METIKFIILAIVYYATIAAIVVFLCWPVIMLLHKMWKQPQPFRSRAWWLAVPFHLLWLPAWYGLLATASHNIEYNPEISRFNEWNITWLLAAFALQIWIAVILLWQYQRGHPRALVRCNAFLLTGFTTMALSYWLADYLYPLLYRWWWQPLLQIMDLGNDTTLRGLNHTRYSVASFLLYLAFLYPYGLVLSAAWYLLLEKFVPTQSPLSKPSKRYKIRRPER